MNHCSILIYYSIPSIKPYSDLSLHTDLKYSNKGVYHNAYNSQRHNTPTAVYSIGGVRDIAFSIYIDIYYPRRNQC